MIPVVVLRPQPGCDATVAAARLVGLHARAFPLFAVAPRRWKPPAADSFDALLLGSANAVRHAGPALSLYVGRPAYPVGAETARAASGAGLEVVTTGSGGLQQALGTLRSCDRRLLRLAGATRVPLDPPPGVTVEERIVYASEPTPMPEDLAALLARPALVLLHSAEAARHFAAECTRLGIDRVSVTLVGLAPRIVAAAGGGWRASESAERAEDAALLALARRMCNSLEA